MMFTSCSNFDNNFFQFRVYKMRQSVKQRAIRVTICDTMGFEQTETPLGPSIRDMEYIMDGHIKDGYEVRRTL